MRLQDAGLRKLLIQTTTLTTNGVGLKVEAWQNPRRDKDADIKDK